MLIFHHMKVKDHSICVTQPNNCEVIVEINSDDEDNSHKDLQSQQRSIVEYLYLNKFKYIKTSYNNKIFPV